MQVGVSLMLDEVFREAALPLFEAGHVDALEYSFELGWARERPAWAEALLSFYGSQGRLWGHGVTYAPSSADAKLSQRAWLKRAAPDLGALELRGVSEHVGFMGVDGADVGAPLPPPPGDASIEVTAAAMQALQAAAGTMVGLENLGLAFCAADAETGALLLQRVLEQIDGYLVLDLHNLFCQAVSLGLEAPALMRTLPLQRAKVMHVSGGSWSEHSTEGGVVRWRRDSHDGPVPAEVFVLLEQALPLCPNLEVVMLEQLGPTLGEQQAARGFAADLAQLRSICGVLS